MTNPEAEMERLQARVHLQVRDEVFFLVLLIDGIYRKYDCSYGLTQALLYLQLVVFSMIFLYASYQEQQDSLDLGGEGHAVVWQVQSLSVFLYILLYYFCIYICN